jgi:16S rRNA G527 N7-methylase RsmG
VLKAVASNAHISIFDSNKRQQIFLDELTREMKRRNVLPVDVTPLMIGNSKVVPFRKN